MAASFVHHLLGYILWPQPRGDVFESQILFHLSLLTHYVMNTMDGAKWGSWSAAVKQKWDPAMERGDAGWQTIKGHDLAHYLKILEETHG